MTKRLLMRAHNQDEIDAATRAGVKALFIELGPLDETDARIDINTPPEMRVRLEGRGYAKTVHVRGHSQVETKHIQVFASTRATIWAYKGSIVYAGEFATVYDFGADKVSCHGAHVNYLDLR